jgi:pyridoxine 4-dehydrogenase
MVNGLADCYDLGLIKAAGVSNYGPKELRKVHQKLEKRGVPLASAQIQFSLLSWGTEQQEAQAVCEELGVGLIAYSPLALGVLSGKYSQSELPPGPRGVLFKGLLPEIQPLLSLMETIAESRRKSMSQVGLGSLPVTAGLSRFR